MFLTDRPVTSDQELLHRTRLGEASAFAALVDRHAAAVSGVAYSVTGDVALAEDIAQETFLHAWRRLGELREEGRLKGWLCAIARNLARSSVRRRREFPNVDATLRAADPGPSPDAVVEARERQALVWDALESLPGLYRESLILYYREARSTREVARALGVSVDVVTQRLSRGRQLLKASVSDLVEQALCAPRKKGLGAAVVASLAAGGLLEPAAAQASPASLIGVTVSTKAKLGVVAVIAGALLVGGVVLRDAGSPTEPAHPARATTSRDATSLDARLARTSASPAAEAASAGSPKGDEGGPMQGPSPAVAGFVEGTTSDALFSGRVINWGTSRGVPGAELSFASADGTQTVRADRQGYFELRVSRPGQVRLATVVASGFLPFAPDWERSPVVWDARPGRTVGNIAVHLSPAIPYRGTVVGPGGEPVSGARVTLLGAQEGEHALVPLELSTFVADNEGRFSFSAPDGMVLEARHERFDAGRARVDGQVQVTRNVVIRLAAKGEGDRRSLSISGRLADQGGEPVPGVRLALRSLSSPDVDPLVVPRIVTSGDDGSFDFHGLPDGTFEVRVVEPGFDAQPHKLSAGARDALIEVREAVRIAGTVTSGGAPVPAFLLVVEQIQGPLLRRRVAEQAFVDAEGRFEVETLGPGDYAIIARPPGLPASNVVRVALERGDESTELVLVVEPGGRISGRVVAAEDRRPLALARVSLAGVSVSSVASLPYAASVVTDESGAFVLEGVPAGRQELAIAAHARHQKIVPGLVVPVGGEVSGGEIALAPLEEGEASRVEVVGIGVAIAPAEDGLRVTKVAPGGGAAEEGMVAGDTISRVDGQSVLELGFREAVAAIRGPADTRVAIAFLRDGALVERQIPRRRIAMSR